MNDRHGFAGLRDFDFLYGQWLVQSRRLRQPLSSSTAWDAFDGWYTCWPLLEGIGNVDELHTEDCGPLRASVRFFDRQSRCWNAWRVCPRDGVLPPISGRFRDGVGTFHGERVIGGRRVGIRYTWKVSAEPRWERAWSTDGGASWEDNWIMDFTRVDWPLETGHAAGMEIPRESATSRAPRAGAEFGSKRRSAGVSGAG